MHKTQTLSPYFLSKKTVQVYVFFSSYYKNTPTGDEVGVLIEVRRVKLQNLMAKRGGGLFIKVGA